MEEHGLNGERVNKDVENVLLYQMVSIEFYQKMEVGIVHYLEIKHIFSSSAAISHKVKKPQIY